MRKEMFRMTVEFEICGGAEPGPVLWEALERASRFVENRIPSSKTTRMLAAFVERPDAESEGRTRSRSLRPMELAGL